MAKEHQMKNHHQISDIFFKILSFLVTIIMAQKSSPDKLELWDCELRN